MPPDASGQPAGWLGAIAVADLVERMVTRGMTLSVAESLTGGLVLAALTDVPGSSAAVLGGVIAYSDTVKVDLLRVDAADLVRHSAVSEPVARQMAEGCRARFGTTVALSTTGEAGPTSATGAPVGTHVVALATAAATRTKSFHVSGDRGAVRRAAVVNALGLLADVLATDA